MSNKVRNGRWVTVLAVPLGLSSIACSREDPAPSRFHKEPFLENRPSSSLLCFDLRDDRRPVAGLVVEETGQLSTVALRSVILPFASDAVEPVADLSSAWGTHGEFTLIYYVAAPKRRGIYGIGIVPRFRRLDHPPDSLDELNQGSLYFIENGIEHRLIYKYPTAGRKKSWPDELSSLPQVPLSWVAVAIPSDAKRREV